MILTKDIAANINLQEKVHLYVSNEENPTNWRVINYEGGNLTNRFFYNIPYLEPIYVFANIYDSDDRELMKEKVPVSFVNTNGLDYSIEGNKITFNRFTKELVKGIDQEEYEFSLFPGKESSTLTVLKGNIGTAKTMVNKVTWECQSVGNVHNLNTDANSEYIYYTFDDIKSQLFVVPNVYYNQSDNTLKNQIEYNLGIIKNFYFTLDFSDNFDFQCVEKENEYSGYYRIKPKKLYPLDYTAGFNYFFEKTYNIVGLVGTEQLQWAGDSNLSLAYYSSQVDNISLVKRDGTAQNIWDFTLSGVHVDHTPENHESYCNYGPLTIYLKLKSDSNTYPIPHSYEQWIQVLQGWGPNGVFVDPGLYHIQYIPYFDALKFDIYLQNAELNEPPEDFERIEFSTTNNYKCGDFSTTTDFITALKIKNIIPNN